MAVNEEMTNRLRKALCAYRGITEKKMFRGVTFMRNDKIFCSSGDDEYLFRIDPTLFDKLLTKTGCRPMIMKGKVITGYLYVRADLIPAEKQLKDWIKLALDYNNELIQPAKQKQTNTRVK